MTISTTGNLPIYTISNTNLTSGSFLTANGSNGTSWVSASPNPAVVVSNNPASLEVKGKIVHNGKDLEERLETIEKVLNIPERDVKLEKNYPRLKKLYDEYIKELSKARMWEELKGNNEN